MTSEMTLVVLSLPIFFEPVYKIHERREVLFMEVKTFWPHLDKLFDNLFFRKIGQNDMLLVLWKNHKSVRNA